MAVKITELTAEPSPVGSDLVVIVDDPSGSPLTKKATITNLSKGIDHDLTVNFVSDEHVPHSSIVLTAGSGLIGGGAIDSGRTFNVGAGNGITVNPDDVAINLAYSPTWTGTHTHNGVLIVPRTTSPTQTAEGSMVWDSDDDLLTIGTGSTRKTLVDINSSQTLTGKTLTSPILNDPTINVPGADSTGDIYYRNGSGVFTRLGIGTTRQRLKVVSGIPTWENNEVTVTLSDGATVSLNASLGDIFDLTASGDRTINAPTNPTSGQKIIIRHKASGAIRALSLNSGTGGFRFGEDITGLSATTSGKIDYIGCIYNLADNKWDVVSYAKGY